MEKCLHLKHVKELLVLTFGAGAVRSSRVEDSEHCVHERVRWCQPQNKKYIGGYGTRHNDDRLVSANGSVSPTVAKCESVVTAVTAIAARTPLHLTGQKMVDIC